jgi:hypothetical protein
MYSDIGTASHECWLCGKSLPLQKAVKVNIGAGAVLLFHETCATAFNAVVSEQVSRYKNLQVAAKSTHELIDELKKSNEPMKKSYNPYEVKQVFGTIDNSEIKKQLEEE